MYNEDRLVHRYNGTEITLRDVQPRDEGEYECALNTMHSPLVLSHSLAVLSEYSIQQYRAGLGN